MALEWRGAAGPYYYKKRRRGSQVCSEYVGGGELGRLAYALDVHTQAERAQQREELCRMVDRERTVDLAVAEFAATVQILADVALIAVGYHAPCRAWRLSRD